MTISIDWGTKVITVPRADLALVRAAPPIEIRELDLNAFRLALKDLEDSDEGMVFPNTHTHETESLLSGILYARKIAIVNDYTVTFEDGQYVVNAVGANSNLSEVRNPNQVSLNTSNSAGLIVRIEQAGALPDQIGELIFDGQFIERDMSDPENPAKRLSFRESMKLVLADAMGLVRGATGGTADETVEILRALAAGDGKVRIRAQCDQYGNRKQIQIDLTD